LGFSGTGHCLLSILEYDLWAKLLVIMPCSHFPPRKYVELHLPNIDIRWCTGKITLRTTGLEEKLPVGRGE